ncbi:MAG: alpha/beta hydrolase [Anaerolineae bacterium]|nr:alpha/beta hydrolase [Anaerolineae bacterium]
MNKIMEKGQILRNGVSNSDKTTLTETFPNKLDGVPITHGHYRQFYSQALEEERTVFISLPVDYETSEKTHPVLYQLDSKKEAFFQSVSMIWYLSEMAEKIPGHIVVGIENTNRHRDFGDGSDRFHCFIQEELIPFINTQYRANDFKILCGQSAGSAFTFHSFVNNPDLFNAYILMSFGCSENSKAVFQNAIMSSQDIQNIHHGAFFFTNAAVDPYDPTGIRTQNGKMVVDMLVEHVPKTNRILYKVYDDEGHVPFPSLYDGLRWFYNKNNRG